MVTEPVTATVAATAASSVASAKPTPPGLWPPVPWVPPSASDGFVFAVAINGVACNPAAEQIKIYIFLGMALSEAMVCSRSCWRWF